MEHTRNGEHDSGKKTAAVSAHNSGQQRGFESQVESRIVRGNHSDSHSGQEQRHNPERKVNALLKSALLALEHARNHVAAYAEARNCGHQPDFHQECNQVLLHAALIIPRSL